MTENSRKVQLESTMDTSATKTGFQSIREDARAMAREVVGAGQQASSGLKTVGDGAGQAQQKVDAATRSIAASVERATAALKAGEKGSSAYFEQLASQRGANLDVLRPYINQLRELEAQQNRTGVSVGQTTAALRQLPAQFTDIVTSLMSGQQPLTVFIQQGGQIKDSFGGAGNALKAMGGYVLGLLNPLTVAAGVALALGAAWYQGDQEARVFQRTLVSTGNQAGVTRGQLADLAREVKESVGGSIGGAAEVLNELAGSGVRGASALRDAAAAAVELQRAGGPAATETAKAFAELAKKPLEAITKLNEAQNFLTESTFDQVKSLSEQGLQAEAAAAAIEIYAGAIKSRAPQMEQSLGSVERAWRFVAGGAKAAWDAMLGVGREASVEEQISRMEQELAKRERFGMTSGDQGARTEALRQQLQLMKEQAAAAQEQAKALGEQAAQTQRLIEYRKDDDRYQTRAEAMQQAITKAWNEGVAAGEAYENIARRVLLISQQFDPQTYLDQIATSENQRNELIKRGILEINGLRERGAINEYESIQRQATADQALLSSRRQALVEQLAIARSRFDSEREISQLQAQIDAVDQQGKTARAKAEQDLATAIDKRRVAMLQAYEAEAAQGRADRDSFERAEQLSRERLEKAQLANADAIRQESEQLRIEASLMGSTEAQRQRALALYKIELELKKQIREIDESDLPGGEAERAEKRAEARAQAAQKAINAEKRATLDEWKELNDEINRTLTDALMRGFEGGKDAARNLRDTVVNMFKTMVLRPVIQPVISAISGGVSNFVSSLFGLGNAGSLLGGAGGGTGVGGGILTALGLGGLSMSSLGSALGAGFMSTLGGGTVIGGGSAAGLLAGGAATGTGVAGMIGAALPWVGGAALLGNALGLFRTTKTVGSGITGTLGAGDIQDFEVRRKSGTLFGGPSYSTPTIGTSALSAGIQSTYQALRESLAKQAAALGLQSSVALNYTAALGTDKLSDDTGGLGIRTEGLSQDEVAAKVKDALAKVGNDIADTLLGPLDRLQKEGESASATLERLAGLSTVVGDLGSLGGVFTKLANASIDAKSNLVDLVGGIDNLSSLAQSYASNYYSRDEIAGGKAASLRETLAGLGITSDFSGDSAKAQFRALVDGTDVSTADGQKRLATLLGIQGDFAQVADYLSETGKSLFQTAALAPESSVLAPLLATTSTQQIEAMNGVRDAINDLHETIKQQSGSAATGGGLVSNLWREVTRADAT